jgi:PAS domain-containing protein
LEYGWFKTRGVPIRDNNGNIVKWCGSCTDITDGKRAEEALREGEQRWRSLTEALPQLVPAPTIPTFIWCFVPVRERSCL